ncbi:MAG: acyl-CoA dehydrogenase domain-containing protein, partial [Mariprofundaceae bacterium]
AVKIGPIEGKLKEASRHGIISGDSSRELVESAQQAGLITREEIALLAEAEKAAEAAIAVDAFDSKGETGTPD